MKVSIIVPFYGVEKYIRDCLDSIKAQTYKDIEVILIDDCSPDNCQEIVKEYLSDDRFKLIIHKKNLGLGGGRNTGVAHSTGELLFFLDSDDVINHHTIEQMVITMKNDSSDLVISPYSKFSYSKDFDFHHLSRLSGGQFVNKYEAIINNGFSVWGILYKRRIIENLIFEEHLIGEDVPYTPIALHRSEKISMLEQAFIGYRYLRPGSISSAFSKHNRGMLRALIILMSCKHEVDDEYLKFIVLFVIKHIVVYSILNEDFDIFDTEEYKTVSKKYRNLKLDKVFTYGSNRDKLIYKMSEMYLMGSTSIPTLLIKLKHRLFPISQM